MTLVTQHIDSLTTELMRLNFMAQELAFGIESQHQLLKVRQMGLTNPIVDEVKSLGTTMAELAEQVGDEQTELAQLRALSQTAALINSSLEWESVITKAMDLVIGLTDAERGYIMLMNERTGKYEFLVARNMDKSDIEDDQFAVSKTIIDQVLRTGQPITTNNAQEDSRFKLEDSIMRYDMRSIMCVPVGYQNEISGVIYCDNPFQQGTFGRKEERLLMAFANQAAIAIKNAQLFEQVKDQIAEVTEIRQFLDNVFSSIGSGIITTGADDLVHTMNPALEEMLDVSAEDCIGRPLTEVLPALYEGFDTVMMNVMEENTVEVIELNTVLPKRGPSFLSLKVSQLRDEEGRAIGLAIVVDDLTEIKQRDEKLNVLQTYLPPAMLQDITSIDVIGLTGEEVISVVFADVRGFTSFSERLEPEMVMEIINQYLTIGADAINEQRGIIDKYMGDCIVGLYGTQLNNFEDHALRAVKTAITTVEHVQVFHNELPKELRLSYGIGIHTDWAVMGNVGSPSRKEFTALGNALIYAKKLQELAQPNEVIISEATYEQVKDDVEVELVERPTRSGDKIIQAYKVLGLQG